MAIPSIILLLGGARLAVALSIGLGLACIDRSNSRESETTPHFTPFFALFSALIVARWMEPLAAHQAIGHAARLHLLVGAVAGLCVLLLILDYVGRGARRAAA